MIPYLDVHKAGDTPDSTNMDKGREGVKNPEIFADLPYGSPHMKCASDIGLSQCSRFGDFYYCCSPAAVTQTGALALTHLCTTRMPDSYRIKLACNRIWSEIHFWYQEASHINAQLDFQGVNCLFREIVQANLVPQPLCITFI